MDPGRLVGNSEVILATDATDKIESTNGGLCTVSRSLPRKKNFQAYAASNAGNP